MIIEATGNLLRADVEALVNTVNTEGAMGKGIALQFRQAYPAMFAEYEKACAAGLVALGKMDVHDLGGLVKGPQWIINFPTKGHWRAKSRIGDIKSGLDDLVRVVERLGIKSIAVPPLGCGYGGLKWAEVRPLIEQAFARLPNVRVALFAPKATPQASEMPNRTIKPRMTSGKAALVLLMDRYHRGMLDPIISLLEIHKLMYFLQAAGEPLKLLYAKGTYGPYAKNLRHLLSRMEQHYIDGYGDGQDDPHKELTVRETAVDEAIAFAESDVPLHARLERVAELIDGFEDPFGLELLSSIHWVTHNSEATTAAAAIAAVRGWNDRKCKLMKPEHLEVAWKRLQSQCWV